MTRDYLTAWVCVDCYFAHHFGVREVDGAWFAGESDTPADREPLTLLEGYELADNTDSETGEGERDFSWSFVRWVRVHAGRVSPSSRSIHSDGKGCAVMTTTQIVETDRARWERHARLLEAARQMESVARSARVAPCDSREMLQEAAELRAMARGIS